MIKNTFRVKECGLWTTFKNRLKFFAISKKWPFRKLTPAAILWSKTYNTLSPMQLLSTIWINQTVSMELVSAAVAIKDQGTRKSMSAI